MPDDPISALRAHLAPIEDLKKAAQVLSWDQETYMPPGGAEARAQQVSTLQTTAHERFVTDETGALLEDAEDALPDDADPLGDDASLVRVVRRDYERARKLPTDLVQRLSEAVSHAKEAWKEARAADDFDHFAPHLEQIVQLNIEKAEALGYPDERYDALLDEYEPGMRTAEVADTFQALRDDLVPIVDAIAEREPPASDFLRDRYPVDRQKAFGESILEDIGYDFERGRQDASAHPFTTSFAVSDVRLTTRYDEHYLPAALFATLHEAGHGLYEQGIDPDLARTPLAEGASLGIHESQSRLWENLVGRSRPFWRHYYADLQDAFPEALGDVDRDAFYRAANKVEPSLIRVEADEVTYNLHVMLRFELERGLITEDLQVEDLPALWNDRMDDYLGVVPDTDANGVLQDVHWSLGAIGYFPTYALGNLMSVPIFNAAQEALPDLDAQIEQGSFAPLLDWLRTHVHQHGRKLEAPDLLERVTGDTLRAGPWLDYIRTKYGAIYGDLP
jgi:carboxypeptidase Taq